ncbi:MULTISPECIES: hypothetical protein [Sphingobacterium]|uniref:hypothetical protein n=1 Tax=Sphingobacterium TaxID=28453 RepID=UPI00257EDEB8|nr:MULTISPECIES: hypothetical protein [Sphingobacterium]
MMEYEKHFGIKFTSDYEEWELNNHICNAFTDYELTTDPDRGRKEIRLEISRFQNELVSEWGDRIENPLNETKYLMKKSEKVEVKFNPVVKVLFGSDEKTYHVNIIPGINNGTQEKGFLLLNEFKEEADPEETDFFPERLHKTKIDAFQYGIDKMEGIVDNDFEEYKALKKAEKRQSEKIPRKIIRDFIKNCNDKEFDSILKNLSEDLFFEIKVNWRQKLTTQGIENFSNYIESSYQELCGRAFKIKSNWTFNDPQIHIYLETFTPTAESEETPKNRYRLQLSFRLENGKINQIILER